jgi:hypothetical protein
MRIHKHILAGWTSMLTGLALLAALTPAYADDLPVPLADSDLQQVTGRDGTTQANINNQASGVNNSHVVGNSVTGQILMDGSAFQDFSGLAVLNANTGNNVSINASMQVNITITPPSQ